MGDDAIGTLYLDDSSIGAISMALLCLMLPAATSVRSLSVDGHALQIDRLKGTKPTKGIDLSQKKLDVASAIIIASCIKENSVLKELKCAAARVFAFVSTPIDTLSALSKGSRVRNPQGASPDGLHLLQDLARAPLWRVAAPPCTLSLRARRPRARS